MEYVGKAWAKPNKVIKKRDYDFRSSAGFKSTT